MDYKEKINQIMGVLGLSKEAPVKEELAEDVAAPEAAPAEAPVEAPAYVTVEQLSSLREEVEMFKKEVVDALAAIVEMGNKTEKNAVPAEMSAESVEEEVEEEEVVELAAEPLKHDPEANVKNVSVKQFSQGRRKTTADIVFESLADAGLWQRVNKN